MTPTPAPVTVDLWFDPVCPYSWTASRWLAEVAARRAVDVRHHLMSLYFLNEHRTDITDGYRHVTETTRGPARVAIAASLYAGEQVLGDLYSAFGRVNFDTWRHPTTAEPAPRDPCGAREHRSPRPARGRDGVRRVRRHAAAQPRRRARPRRWGRRHPHHPHRRGRVLRPRAQRHSEG